MCDVLPLFSLYLPLSVNVGSTVRKDQPVHWLLQPWLPSCFSNDCWSLTCRSRETRRAPMLDILGDTRCMLARRSWVLPSVRSKRRCGRNYDSYANGNRSTNLYFGMFSLASGLLNCWQQPLLFSISYEYSFIREWCQPRLYLTRARMLCRILKHAELGEMNLYPNGVLDSIVDETHRQWDARMAESDSNEIATITVPLLLENCHLRKVINAFANLFDRSKQSSAGLLGRRVTQLLWSSSIRIPFEIIDPPSVRRAIWEQLSWLTAAV